MASTRIAGLALAACGGLMIACPAPAQVAACNEANAVLGILRDRYHELPVFRGMTHDGNAAVVTLSLKGTWSVVTVPDGAACLVGAGGDAMIVPPARPDGAPS